MKHKHAGLYLAGLLLYAALVLPATGGSAVDRESLEALMEAGHWKQARVLVERNLQALPEDPRANYLMAKIKQVTGDLDGALRHAEKAVGQNANNADFHYVRAIVMGQMAEKASVFSKLGLVRKFVEGLETTISLDAQHIDARLALISFYMNAPGIVGGDKGKARKLAEEIQRIDLSRGFLALARIATAEKQTAQLEQLYRKALEANPRSYPALLRAADFHSSDSQKDFERAEVLAKDALRLEPNRVGAYIVLAGAYTSQARWKDLDDVLKRAEVSVPDDLTPYYMAGLRILALHAGEMARAENCFRKYLSKEPELNEPSLGHAHWRLGQVMEKQGRKAEAMKEFELAIQLKPDLEDAKKDLKRLK